jgi:hypothetical protein
VNQKSQTSTHQPKKIQAAGHSISLFNTELKSHECEPAQSEESSNHGLYGTREIYQCDYKRSIARPESLHEITNKLGKQDPTSHFE